MSFSEAIRLILFALVCVGLTQTLTVPGKTASNGRINSKAFRNEDTKETEFRMGLNGGITDQAQPKAQSVKDMSTRKSGGFGMSAWALILLILSVILCGVFMYYATIFYPILCKKERKYDVMEASATP